MYINELLCMATCINPLSPGYLLSLLKGVLPMENVKFRVYTQSGWVWFITTLIVLIGKEWEALT